MAKKAGGFRLIVIFSVINILQEFQLQSCIKAHHFNHLNEEMTNIKIKNLIEDNLPRTENCSSIVLSCKQWKFCQPTFTKLKINSEIMKGCRKTYSHLHPINGNNLFKVTHHNALESITSLLIYWKAENAAFFIDSHIGIGEKELRAYLHTTLFEVIFEIIWVKSKMDLVNVIKITARKFLNVVIVCNNENTIKIIKAAELNNLFNTNVRLIMLSQMIPEIIRKVFISAESQVTLISTKIQIDKLLDGKTFPTPQQEKLKLNALNTLISPEEKFSAEYVNAPSYYFYDMFYSCHTKQVEIVKFARWTVEQGLFMLENLEEDDLKHRLKGRRIKTAAFQHLPYIVVNSVNGTMSISGYKVEIKDWLMEYFNANQSTDVYKPEWGLLVNGTYTGLTGVIYRKEGNKITDVTVNGFALTEYRLQALRYLAPLAKLDLSLTYTTPIPVILPTTYIFPFSGAVWLSIVFSFLCAIITLAIAMYFSPSWRTADIPSLTSHTTSFRLITLTFFEEALKNPPGRTAKVIYGTLLVATLSVFVFYTSVFTSFLAYRDLKMPIRNLHDLIESREYKAITLKSTVYEAIFRFAKGGIFKDMWKKMEKTEKFSIQPTLVLGRDRIYEGKNVFLIDGASIIATMQNNCSISLIRTGIFRDHLLMTTRNDFPYSRMFYTRILRITEGGLIQRLGIRYMTQSRPPCDKPVPSLTLGISQVVGLFFILSCGIIISLVTLISEIIYNNKHNRPN